MRFRAEVRVPPTESIMVIDGDLTHPLKIADTLAEALIAHYKMESILSSLQPDRVPGQMLRYFFHKLHTDTYYDKMFQYWLGIFKELPCEIKYMNWAGYAEQKFIMRLAPEMEFDLLRIPHGASRWLPASVIGSYMHMYRTRRVCSPASVFRYDDDDTCSWALVEEKMVNAREDHAPLVVDSFQLTAIQPVLRHGGGETTLHPSVLEDVLNIYFKIHCIGSSHDSMHMAYHDPPKKQPWPRLMHVVCGLDVTVKNVDASCASDRCSLSDGETVGGLLVKGVEELGNWPEDAAKLPVPFLIEALIVIESFRMQWCDVWVVRDPNKGDEFHRVDMFRVFPGAEATRFLEAFACLCNDAGGKVTFDTVGETATYRLGRENASGRWCSDVPEEVALPGWLPTRMIRKELPDNIQKDCLREAVVNALDRVYTTCVGKRHYAKPEQWVISGGDSSAQRPRGWDVDGLAQRVAASPDTGGVVDQYVFDRRDLTLVQCLSFRSLRLLSREAAEDEALYLLLDEPDEAGDYQNLWHDMRAYGCASADRQPGDRSPPDGPLPRLPTSYARSDVRFRLHGTLDSNTNLTEPMSHAEHQRALARRLRKRKLPPVPTFPPCPEDDRGWGF